MALPRIGAHISVAGGLQHIRQRAADIGAEVVQIFASNPRQWRPSRHGPDDFSVLSDELAAAHLPLVLHTIYLINLASPDAQLRRRSLAAVADTLVAGAQAGAIAVVTHIGSHRGDGFEAAVPRVAAAVAEAFAIATRRAAGRRLPQLLLENSAGGSASLGAPPAELGRLLAAAGMGPALGICLDTAHAFAAGYSVHSGEGLDTFLGEVAREVGLSRVGLIHLNDSATPLGARRDRHENLWQGHIGKAGLARWVRHPELCRVPFVLETPGFAQRGPDRRNLWRAKRLRSSGSG